MAENLTFPTPRSSLFARDPHLTTLHVGARPKRETGRQTGVGAHVTGAIRITPMRAGDVDRLARDCDVPDVVERLSYYPAPTLHGHLERQWAEHDAGTDFMWVADDEEGTLGWFGMFSDQGHDEGLEIGIFLHPRARGTRAAELAVLLCAYAAEIVGRPLVASVERDNLQSHRGLLRAWPNAVAEEHESGYADCVLYRLDGAPLRGLVKITETEREFVAASIRESAFTGRPLSVV